MILKQAFPILIEFGYHFDRKANAFLVKYTYRNRHICQGIYVDVIKSLRNQQQLRKIVLMIYEDCIKKLKLKYCWIDKNKVLPTTKLEKEDPADWWKK